MELSPDQETTDLDDEEGKIGDDVYVHAGNDNETSNFEKEKYSIASM